MKLFTDEAEELIAKVIVHGSIILLLLALLGIAGGIEYRSL